MKARVFKVSSNIVLSKYVLPNVVSPRILATADCTKNKREYVKALSWPKKERRSRLVYSMWQDPLAGLRHSEI
jgi:hypothetical protein